MLQSAILQGYCIYDMVKSGAVQVDGFFVAIIYGGDAAMAKDADTAVAVGKKRSVGRPELYPVLAEPRLDDIYEWVAEGNTEKSICKKLGIHHSTWIEWKDKYPELAATITRARQAAGQLLLNKQFAAGCGQKVTVRKQKALKDGSIVEVEEEEYIPPNVQAAEFWARHMMPDYVPPKQADTTKTITVNFQLEDWEQKRKQILDEIKRLELQAAVDVEAVPVEE